MHHSIPLIEPIVAIKWSINTRQKSCKESWTKTNIEIHQTLGKQFSDENFSH